ncbi:Lipase_3 domain-containing protein [Durusdinium trenchii]|uniref:Lipase_3 domain-containing protein n=1 Tax=Durusdinium trenchii TaxID=1381693 RepID=A0ABP0RJF9_9DINO
MGQSACGQASTIYLPSGIRAARERKFHSSCSVNGRVVAVPCYAEKILVVDPTSREAFAIDLPSGISADRAWTFCSSCSVNGRVVAVPDNAEKILDAEKILVVDVNTSNARRLSLELPTSDVHNTPQFADLVAALLSSWIYGDDPEPPQTMHASFEVHKVIQPGDFGRSLKIASVTAHLPTGKVLYIVFKGTSYMLDFLNWNLEHDHEITGETDFFAHGGTASTIRSTKFLKSDIFLSRLVAARGQGVRKVVFTGHSLGGMYAQMCLFLAWKEMRGTGSLSEVLSSLDLQSFTFGAPMVFGGNSQKARDFKNFAREHAVNYILSDDPCARAWGALNLRHFVQQATLAVKKGLQDTYGSVKGTLASRVVEQIATHLLERPDFLMIEDFARKYEHVVPLRVLSADRQHVRWKEFRLTPECFEDHSIECYVNKLFDAFEQSRPECHIHEQPFEM